MLHNEIAFNGRTLIISTVKIPGGLGCMTTYETMAMFADTDMDMDYKRTHDYDDAVNNHRKMLDKYVEMENHRLQNEKKKNTPAPALPAKYAKLRDDIRAALESTEWAEQTEDGGTCNFDAPVLDLPRWNESMIKRAAAEAGGFAFKWRRGRKMLGWVISPRSSGQGNRRTRRAEAMRDELKKRGYSVGMYYQMD